MARIRWYGQEFTAEPIKQLPNGNWLMRSKEHGARFVPGTEIEVRQSEIIEMAAAEKPTDPKASLGMLEAAMAEERKTLTPVTELLAQAPKTVREPQPSDDQVKARSDL